MKKIVVVTRSENFTPADLMKQYADLNPNVSFSRSFWGNARLTIEGLKYRYHHWDIIPEDSRTIVVLSLELDA